MRPGALSAMHGRQYHLGVRVLSKEERWQKE